MSTADGRIIGTTTLVDNGSRDQRLNLIILSDGYREAELGKFANDANAFISALFNTRPWGDYRDAINIFRIDVASTDSGADNPHTGVTRATYFDSTFWADGVYERLLAANAQTALNVVLAQLPSIHPAPGKTQILVLVNDPKYGGAGGAIATASTAPESARIAIHEVGHSLFGLADEYCGTEAAVAIEPKQANVTLTHTPTTLKWRDLVAKETAVPTTAAPSCAAGLAADGVVGAYEGAHRRSSALYRPATNCYMRELGQPFCAVCQREMRSILDPRRIQPIDRWAGQWTPDWSHFAPFVAGGQPHFACYRKSSGEFSIDRVRADGKGTESVFTTRWTPGWTTLMPFELGGRPRLLVYSANNGQVWFEEINVSNAAAPIIDGYHDTWTTDWTHFMPFTLGGQPHYVAYKMATGQVSLDRIRADGSGTDTLFTDTWRAGWSHFMPFTSGGRAHFLLYNTLTGEVFIERIKADGGGFDDLYNDTWTPGWTSFSPFEVAGKPHYLGYKAGTGDVCVERIRADGSRTDTLYFGRWTTDWTTFAPFMLGGEPHHLIYKITDGRAAIECTG